MVDQIKGIVSVVFGISLCLAVLLLALWGILGAEQLRTVLIVGAFLILILASMLAGGVYTYVAFRSGVQIGSHTRVDNEQAELLRAKYLAQYNQMKPTGDPGYPPRLPAPMADNGNVIDASFRVTGLDD